MERRNFLHLLNSRKERKKTLSGAERNLLQDAVFQLVSYHSNSDRILQEAKNMKVSGASLNRGNSGDRRVEDVLKSCFSFEKTDKESSFLILEKVVHKLLLTSKIAGTQQCFTEDQKVDIQTHIACLSSAINEQSFQKPRVLNLLCKEKCLPILYLWYLHKEDVMTLASYFTFKTRDSGFIPAFTDNMIGYMKSLSLKSDRNNEDCTVFTNIFQLVVSFTYSDQVTDKSCRKVSNVCLETFSANLLDELMSGSPLFIPDLLPDCHTDLTKKFCSHTIQQMLGHKPVYKVADALSSKDWTYAKVHSSLLEWFKILLLPFDPVGVLDLIRQVLEHQEVNWQLVLTFLSTVLVCMPDVSQHLQDYIQESLRSGLENSNIEELVIGFLFARQGSCEGSHVFMTYADWFQRVFGDSVRSPANSRKTFTVLIKFLTDIVPFEQPQYLKVHILRPPHVPTKCRELFTDYLSLAKTRLADLKQPADTVGLYDSSGADVDKDLSNQIKDDIQKAINSFASNRKIPSVVMEASIFRRPYFVGKFLPVLLKPRTLPDVADLRMEFIEALKKVEKISVSMYNTYKEKCKAEAARLLGGAFPEEEGLDDMDLEPLDQLQYRLDNLLNTMLSSKSDVSESVAMVRERLQSLCSEEVHLPSTSLQDDTISLDPLCADISEQQIKICDILLNFFCKATLEMLKQGGVSCYWASSVMDVIVENRHLHKALLSKVWCLIMIQGTSLDENHVRGLATVLVHLARKQGELSPVRVTCPWKNCRPYVGTFSSLLWEHIPYYTSQWIVFALRLSSEYISCCVQTLTSGQLAECKDQLFPPALCCLFEYLCRRLVTDNNIAGHLLGSDTDSIQSVCLLAHTVRESDTVQKLMGNKQVSLSDWLSFEMHVSPEDEILCFSDRQRYIHDMMYNMYLNPVDEEECAETYNATCSKLMQKILQADLNCCRACEETVCHQCQANHRISRYQSNRCTFVNLLQGLCCHITPPSSSPDVSSSPPWLIQQFLHFVVEATPELSSPEQVVGIHKHTTVLTFLRLVQCLPAHLFFCDDLKAPLNALDELKGSISVINDFMRNALSDGPSLTVQTTLYLLKGVAEVCGYHQSVLDVLDHCPLLVLSTLRHYKHTAGILANIVNKQTSGQVIEMARAVKLLQRLPNVELSSQFSSPWVTAGVFLALITRIWRDSKDLEGMSARLLQSCDKQTVEMCFGILLSQITTNKVNSSEVIDQEDALTNLLTTLVGKCPSVLVDVFSDQQLQQMTHILPDFISSLLPWTVLRFLRDRPSVWSKVPNRLNFMLTQYSKLAHLIDNPSSNHEDLHMAFSMHDFLELNVFVKQTISGASREELQSLDEGILQKCEVDLTMEYQRAVKKALF